MDRGSACLGWFSETRNECMFEVSIKIGKNYAIRELEDEYDWMNEGKKRRRANVSEDGGVEREGRWERTSVGFHPFGKKIFLGWDLDLEWRNGGVEDERKIDK